ncbi:uncharacterized protein N7529_004161 [Penicillium soppii]|uniref:uncharacterized protein n=1 Tax=Penicillium soppii TaxID=69789 RepID=UPI0025483CDF|nr:uncharacterized protein N7529_004161 [Penicillium soppii]KAJ5871808.1 hypothetical protein N7529_004161 [Penicillium soppii]
MVPKTGLAHKNFTDKQSKEEEQESSALVLGRFLILFVRDQVPGVQIGDNVGRKVFWNMDDEQHHIIREAFESKPIRWATASIPNSPIFYLLALAFCSLVRRICSGIRSLITLYGYNFVVGFRQPTETKRLPWRERKFYLWGLSKPPKKIDWHE